MLETALFWPAAWSWKGKTRKSTNQPALQYCPQQDTARAVAHEVQIRLENQ